MLTERSIINFLIWIGGMILGPYLVISTLYGNSVPVLVFGGVVAVACVFGFIRDYMCVLPILGLALYFQINFLPLKLTPWEICVLALIGYYLITYAALRHRLMKTGPLLLFLPIMIIGLIVLYHEHSFGLKSMGAGREGARGAIFMLLACVAYVCGSSVDSPPASSLRLLPVFCFLLTLLAAVPYTLSTFVPSTAPYLYIFTNDINGSALAAQSSGGDAIVRNSGPAAAAQALIACLIAFYPIGTWWRPRRWWVAILALLCVGLVITGGFRSGLVGLAMVVGTGAFCYYTWRVFLLLPVVVLVLGAAIAIQGSHTVKLPESAQRTLSFLPGQWDPDVMDNAQDSIQFRSRIWDTYMKEDFQKSPLLGNGFSYDSDEFDRYNFLALTQDTPDHYYSTKIFVTGKMFHTGWISLYDAMGLIGGAVFVLFSLSLILMTGKSIFAQGVDRSSPLFPVKVWLFCAIVPSFIGFFTLFGDIKQTFPFFCYYSILWVHLARLENRRFLPRSMSSDLVPQMPETLPAPSPLRTA